MSVTGHNKIRHPDDSYITPAWCTRAILPHLRPGTRTVLEPAVGAGAIARLLRERLRPERLDGIDIDEGRLDQAALLLDHSYHGDFLEPHAWPVDRYDLCLTNPPFSLAREYIERSLPICVELALLLRVNFLASQERKALHRAHPSDLFVLPRRPSFVWVVRCAEKCGYEELVDVGSVTSDRCPRCNEKVKITKSDSAEYAWWVWGPGRGNRWFLLDEVD